MKNFIAVFLITILVLPFLSCGKKGDILPPLVRLPQTAENVQIAQKADQIVLTWRNPIAYEDGSTLSLIEKIEIWILEEKASEGPETTELPVEEFERMAKLHATITEDQIQDFIDPESTSQGQMVYPYTLSGKESLSKKYTFGLRVKEKKRYSSFSVLVSLKPMILPLPPTDVAVTVFSDRIEVKWNPPLKNRDQTSPPNVEGYNIYRSDEEGESRRLNQKLIKGEKYDDKNFGFDQVYKYFVRASATSTSPFLESEDSEEIEILPKDTFAPDPPKGLISVAGQDVLSITWDANTEYDLDGYRVWRREQGTAEVRLLTPDLIKENAYNDKLLKKGMTYIYFITALDKSGNESQRSETISDMIRERIR
jgi:hypothetical protein